jgi:hypothetical protein
MHHTSIFSIMYLVIVKYLEPIYGYDRVLLLHRNEKIDPRLLAMQNSSKALGHAEFILINIESDGFNPLRNIITNKTIVVYFGDFPHSLFDKKHRGDRSRRRLRLSTESGVTYEAEGFSIANILARRFKAKHILLDIPESNKIRLRNCDKNSSLNCSLTHWVFWPSISTLFSINKDSLVNNHLNE